MALNPAAADRDEGRSMPYCTPGELDKLWSKTGLADVAVSGAVVHASYDDFDDL